MIDFSKMSQLSLNGKEVIELVGPDGKLLFKKQIGPDLTVPLCFTAVDPGATIALTYYNRYLASAEFQTSTDNKTWSDYAYDNYITLAHAGDKVYFRAKFDNTSIPRSPEMSYLNFKTTQDDNYVSVSGNIMSMLMPEFENVTSIIRYAFVNLFRSCENVYDCSKLLLPAMSLAQNCYMNMFQDCDSLQYLPMLPATALADSCYMNMFSSCNMLFEAAPELPASEYIGAAYQNMFAWSPVEQIFLPNVTIQQVMSWETMHDKGYLLSDHEITIHCKDGSKTVTFSLIR